MAFALFLALWPVACVLAAVRHSIARQWRRLGQLALLLPLWTIAVSLGLLKLTPFLSDPAGARPAPDPFLAAPAIGLALCCGAAAWWLLYRTFGAPVPPERQA